MSIFNRRRQTGGDASQNGNQERIDGGDYGIHFPWVSIIFLIVGIASEITDAFLLHESLGVLARGLSDEIAYLISFITGAVCFFSMAAIGYQSANTRVKYSTKTIEIAIWLAVGIYIASLRILLAVEKGETGTFVEVLSNHNSIMGFLQLLLYIGTGFMTYSSVKQLTNAKLYEYIMAKREYNKLLDEIADRREFIIDGVSELSLYQNYADRLVKSKKSVMSNVAQYNESVKAMCEAKMAVATEPNQMDDMYERAINKEKSKTMEK